ncbi:MAG: GAF domain-containing protein, partial [Chloroflexota bacterium]
MITQERTSQVKARIMNHLGPTMIVFFIAVGIIGAIGILFDARENTARIQAITLEDVSRQYSDAYGTLTGEVRDLSTDPVTREFAIAAASPGISADDFRTAQTNFVVALTDLLENNDGIYRAARFIDADGSVWVNGTLIDGVANIDDDIDLRVRDPQADPIMAQGFTGEAGTVAIGDLTVVSASVDTDSLIPVVTLFAPVTRSSDFSGVIGLLEIEADMTTVFSTVRNATAISSETGVGANQRYLLVNNTNHVLTDSSTTLNTHLAALAALDGAEPVIGSTMTNFLQQNTGEFTPRWQPGSGALVGADMVQSGQLAATPWRLIVIDSAFEVFGGALLRAAIVLVISILAGPAMWWLANRHLERVLRRMSVANENLQQLAAVSTGQAILPDTPLSIPADIDRDSSPDESSQMLRAVSDIEQYLKSMNTELETQSSRYVRNLSVAAQIGRETATLDDVDDLLNRAINLISSTFGLYHAQVFMVDDAKTNAVLIYSPGEAGEQLLEMGHKLPVGSKSVIGRVTETGQPVIVNDTGSTRATGTHAFNPILKDTRAEMALPLQIGDDTIGALDLQSDQPGFFTEDDLQTYQLLADQIAIALYKTRLLQEYDDRIEQIEMLNRQLTQMAWDELEQEVGLDRTYRYNLLEVETGDAATRPVYTTSQMMRMPIRIRGRVIGTIHASPPDGADFTPNDRIILQSVAERVALAVENARLFQETQNNLSETSTLYQTSRYLNEADEPDSIIRAIVLSAMPSAAGGQIALFNEVNPDWLEVVATWAREDIATSINVNPVGTRFHLPDYDLFDSLSSGQVTLVSDTTRDNRVNEELRQWFLNLYGRSVVFIPLTVRGAWRGTVMVEFDEPREFTDREGRIYNNLIDQAGVAIDNRLLIERTERALNLNERLYATSSLINQSDNFQELLHAFVSTSDDPSLDFVLATFTGELDETGYPTAIRVEARSRDGQITRPNMMLPIQIERNSLLRRREPIALDENANSATGWFALNSGYTMPRREASLSASRCSTPS